MILTRVDLPAPFSPSSACTSPARRSKLTPSSARTPGKLLAMSFSSNSGPAKGSLRRFERLRPVRHLHLGAAIEEGLIFDQPELAHDRVHGQRRVNTFEREEMFF